MDKRTKDEAALNEAWARINAIGGTGPWCSFCGLAKNEVERLFDGPEAHICGDCVVLMAGMLHEPERPAFRPLADFVAELERLRVEYGPHRAALSKARAS